MNKFNEGDKVRVKSDGRIFTVDWRTMYNDFTGSKVFVKEIDGEWFFRDNLEQV
jgi:hypothetical protein